MYCGVEHWGCFLSVLPVRVGKELYINGRGVAFADFKKILVKSENHGLRKYIC